MKLILFSSVFLACNCIILCQDVVFPDNYDKLHPNKNKATVEDRLSGSIPNDCPKNMELYSIEGDNVPVCDCKARFLYLPSNDSCYEAYRQGPCPLNYYVALPRGESTAQCVKNPCLQDGLVKYNNICYPLKTKGGPCEPDVLGINEITFQLECKKADIVPYIIIGAPLLNKTKVEPCPPGSRRTTRGKCRKPAPMYISH